MSVLDRILRLLGLTIYFLGLSKLVIIMGRRNPKVLLFHDIAAQENDFVAGLNTTMHPDTFALHLEYLSKHYEILPIDELANGPASRSRVSIAFDDGYRSVLENALPIMESFNVTAIIYLITQVVGNRALVWVNELNCLLRQGGSDALSLAHEALGISSDTDAAGVISAIRVSFDRKQLNQLLTELREQVSEDPLSMLEYHPLYLNWDEVRTMAALGITFGNHTASHPNMGRLTEPEQRAEIFEAQSVLCEEGVETIHFAYPFGHHNDATARLAWENGLRWIAEVGGSNRLSGCGNIARVDVRATSTAELFTQIEVVEPLKALLRRILKRPKAGWEPQIIEAGS